MPPDGVSYGHNPRIILVDEEDDKVTRALKRTGCLDQSNAVNECHFETKDWRKCTEQLNAFKTCMADFQKLQKQLRGHDTLDRRQRQYRADD